jgi:hypothetical protein
MASRSALPSRFPAGTKLVIEGRPRGEGQVQVSKRYLEFPDGTFIRLPLHPRPEPRGARRPLRGQRPARSAAQRSRRGADSRPLA